MRHLPLAVIAALALALATTASAAPPDFRINGRPASARDLEIIHAIARASGQPAKPGAYWYDDATGALGRWGGPTLVFLRPGLGLGGPLPANASGGGDGQLTGVFINGRELHPQDVQGLAAMIGTPVLPGRWWVDAAGNAGREGGPPMFNLLQLAKARGQSSYFRKGSRGDSTFVGKGCAAVHGHTGSGDSKSDYSYYVGCD